jgi:hypothetical protein
MHIFIVVMYIITTTTTTTSIMSIIIDVNVAVDIIIDMFDG